ncbi:(2Fe-2S)-binding protein [Bacillus sp. JJ1503]|uniref:(2Fe-2S)-binding protein n=1 Tax=Bacillus sp. JJ1503 TaxID=3122956 RepID=UPI002FFF2ACE
MTRIIDHPILGKLEDRKSIPFTFDGKTIEAFENETIAATLLANGIRKLRVHEDCGTPRGFYCNIGHCMECRVTVNHQANVRACLTVVEKDMVVESGKHLPNIVRKMVEQQ